MNEFHDTLTSLTAARDSFAERVVDGFGKALITDVFDPILVESSGLVQLSECAEQTMRRVDQMLQEAGLTGELMP